VEKRRFVILGLGQFGQQLVVSLTAKGHDVVALDQELAVVEEARAAGAHAVVADGAGREELSDAVGGGADTAVVSLGKAMDSSILATMHLKELRVKEIVVKALSAEHGRILRAVGATEVIFPEQDMAVRLAQELAATDVVHEVPFFEGHALVEMDLPRTLEGESLARCNLRARFNLNVVRIRRFVAGREQWQPATATEPLRRGDVLLVLAREADVAAFREVYPLR
jgi:trk system potassium uptake protein TrkA